MTDFSGFAFSLAECVEVSLDAISGPFGKDFTIDGGTGKIKFQFKADGLTGTLDIQDCRTLDKITFTVVAVNENNQKSKAVEVNDVPLTVGDLKRPFRMALPLNTVTAEGSGWTNHGVFKLNVTVIGERLQTSSEDESFEDDSAALEYSDTSDDETDKDDWAVEDFTEMYGRRTHTWKTEYKTGKMDLIRWEFVRTTKAGEPFVVTLYIDSIIGKFDVTLEMVLQNEDQDKMRVVRQHIASTKKGDTATFEFNVTQDEIADPTNEFIKDDKITLTLVIVKRRRSISDTFTVSQPTGIYGVNYLGAENDVYSFPRVDRYTSESANSKTSTGYVGLKNQGATCYMNAMLQSLYHVPAFRRIVYEMPTTGTEDVKTSIPLNLQRLFCKMQLGESACSTKPLTVSFGWDDYQTIVQHDTQEFCRVLMDNLETKMKGSPLEGRIAKLFRGKFRSFVRCTNVTSESSRIEEFYDLSMQVKDCPTLESSFEKYTEQEKLEGENKYKTDDFGLQDALMGVEFVEFPPVLQLHLRRFEYDMEYDRNVKVNSKFVFPTEIDLEKYLASDADRSTPSVYDLYGVLVHSGGVSYGHYYAFLRTSTDMQWYEFNDSFVSRVSKDKAIEDNFGGDAEKHAHSKYTYASGYASYEKSTNAYILVYVKRDEASEIFEPISDESVPQHLRDYLKQPDEGESAKKAREITCYVIDDCLRQNCRQGASGFACSDLGKKFSFSTKDSYREVYERVAEAFDLKADQIRLWYGQCPSGVLQFSDAPASYTQYYKSLFLQKLEPGDVWKIAEKTIMVYIKFFCPEWKAPLQYVGMVAIDSTVTALEFFAIVRRMMGMPEDTPLQVFEETLTKYAKPVVIDTMEAPFNKSSRTTVITNGALLIFQVCPGHPFPETSFVPDEPIACEVVETASEQTDEALKGIPVYRYNDFDSKPIDTVPVYFSRKLSTQFTFAIYFYDEPTKILALLKIPGNVSSKEDTTEFVIAALKLDVDMEKDTVLLYKSDYYVDEKPGATSLQESRSYNTTIGSLYQSSEKKICRLFVRIIKGVTREQYAKSALVKVAFQDSTKGVAETVIVAIPKQSQFSAVLNELDRLGFLAKIEGPTRKYQIKEGAQVCSMKPETMMYGTKEVRIEVIPEDQRDVGEDEFILPVVTGYVDYQGYIGGTGAVQFMKIRKTDTLETIKPKLMEVLGVNEDEMKKAKFFSGDRWVKFDRKNSLKDDCVIYELNPKYSFFSVVNSKRKGNSYAHSEEALKIDN